MSDPRPFLREADTRLLDFVRALARDHAKADMAAGHETVRQGSMPIWEDKRDS